MSFKSWCQRARIAAAIERLSTDASVSVKQLASDLGYASVPAFSHAFRQVTGKDADGIRRRRLESLQLERHDIFTYDPCLIVIGIALNLM